MWLQLEQDLKKNKFKESFRRNRASTMDCSGSSKGLFLGIIIFVAIIIILITLFVLTRAEGFKKTAVRLEHISDMVIYTVTSIAVCLSFNRAQGLRRDMEKRSTLEEILLVLSLIGVYGLCIANVIAGAKSSSTNEGRFIVASNCLHLLQASVQTIFLLGNAQKRMVKREHLSKKPGREFVTFLLVCNLAIFIMTLFKAQQSSVTLVQTRLYGSVTWNIITHATVPITIFFRFQSSVCLANIWKYSWRPIQNGE